MLTGLAQIAAVLLLSSPQDTSFVVLKALDGPDLVSERIEADAIGLPPGLEAADFAAHVVDAEHLTAWNNGSMTEGEATGPLSYKAMIGADGRGVVVYYSRDPAAPRAVCRLRVSQSYGLTDARFRALRWCAVQVGVLLPDKPAPPVERRGPR